jgi:hypothetical protein
MDDMRESMRKFSMETLRALGAPEALGLLRALG